MIAVIVNTLWMCSVCALDVSCECVFCIISLSFQSSPVGGRTAGKLGAVICPGRMVLEQSVLVTQHCGL